MQGIALVGAGVFTTIQSIQAYLIDAFTLHAASGVAFALQSSAFTSWLTYFLVFIALAAATFLRSLTGFGFPLFAPKLYSTLGYGKGDTILAAAAIVLGCPTCVKNVQLLFRMLDSDAPRLRPWLFWFYGERIRNASRFARKSNQ
jgi:hypothetical protein